jgi:glucan phosphoethanolaminetransferase (alkaline phosphatase superfamily)
LFACRLAVWALVGYLVLPFDPSASFNSLLLISWFFLGVFFLGVLVLCTIIRLLYRRPKLSPTAQLVTVLYIHSVVLARHHLNTLRPNNSRNLTAGFKQTDPLHATFASHTHFPQLVPPLFAPCDALETVTG